MSKLTRKEMKENELEVALVEAKDYILGHSRQTVQIAAAVAGGAAAVALIVWGVQWWQRGMGTKLSEALAIYGAPLVTDGAAAPGQTIYKSAEERAAKAQEKLKDLAESSPGSQAGQAARLALLAAGEKKYAGADSLERVRSLADSSSLVAAVAAVSYLEAQAEAGKAKDVIDVARRFAESSSSPLPKDVALFELARLYERTGQLADAKRCYQQISTEFPESPYRGDAAQRLAAL